MRLTMYMWLEWAGNACACGWNGLEVKYFSVKLYTGLFRRQCVLVSQDILLSVKGVRVRVLFTRQCT